MIIAIDSKGNLQRINAATGANYSVQLPNISFTNTSPAIDDKHIYLSIRTTTKGKGALIAVDRATFQEVWRKDLDYPANTNPLVLTAPGAVLVGDIKGHLYAFKTTNGEKADLFLDAAGKTIGELNNIPGDLDPLGESYQTLTGLSETILASGSTGQPLLITGISGRLNGKPDGYLVAYGTKPGFDATWVEASLPPQGGTVHVKLTANQPVDKLPVDLYFQPQNGAPQHLTATTLDLKPGESKAVPYSIPPGLGAGTLYAIINAGAVAAKGGPLAAMILAAHTPPAAVTGRAVETDLSNNVISAPITAAADLAVTLQASPTYDCLAAKPATVTFQNPSPTALKAQVQVSLGATSLLSGTLTLAPGATTKSLTLAGIPCGSAATLEASIAHQDPALTEANLANNQASTTVSVSTASATTGTGPTVIMLPEDCAVNPDWTSSYPCLNYPGLYVP